MDATKTRDKVAAIAKRDFKQALKLARAIDDPWYRCQALAIAAASAERSTRSTLLKAALEAGRQLGEPNRVVSVSAWPIKVYCLSDQVGDDLHREVADLLRVAGREPSPVRRADALNLLLGAVITGPRSLFWTVYEPFFAACTGPLASGKRNVRGESMLAGWAAVIAQFDRHKGLALVEAIQGSTLRKRAVAAADDTSAAATRAITWPHLG